MNQTRMKLILLIVIIMWGTNFVIMKILAENFPLWTLLLIRNIFAALALFWILRKSLFIKPGNKKIWGYVIGASIFGVFINNVFMQIGINYTLATNASLILGLTPLATTTISYLVFHESVHWKQIFGILLGLCGVLLVVLKGSIKNLLELSFNLGDLLVIGSLITFSLSFIFIKKATDSKFPPEMIILYGSVITSICTLPMVAWELTMEGLNEIPTDILLWILVIYAGIFPLGVGNMLWNRGISVLGPSQCAMFMNGVPLVAAIASLFILREPILWIQIIGFLFIATGVFFASKTYFTKIEMKQKSVEVPDLD